MHPKVIIVGTVPYNRQSTSRAFDSYFHNWEKENLAQFFSNAKKPCKGHCGTFFQITDQRLIKRRFNKHIETGTIYYDYELGQEWANTELETDSAFFSKLYKIGKNKTSLNHLLRKWVWKRKYWDTPLFRQWLEDFKPDCVFLSFSDDFFILEIALYIAEKFDIPIISSTGDDYYFNDRFSLSPFYWLYRYQYKKLNRNVFKHKGSAIYIGDKIRDKYNQEFELHGETVYLTSEIERQPFRPINTDNPKIVYCGNIRLGRNRSLCDIADALQQINANYRLTVYSGEKDTRFTKKLIAHKGIDFRGSVPYATVQQEMSDCDIAVIVEGFSKQDVITVKYSVSTKVADSIASGRFILCYGHQDCGAIDQMQQFGCSLVCNSRNKLAEKLSYALGNVLYQEECYRRSEKVFYQYYQLESSTTVFEGIVENAISGCKNG